ncbi:MAG: redox-regulated ATPase YchF [Thermoleophilum sp.]|nr:redox-regulated ATPase YchF [Thermoleophilum sp.]
MKRIGIVGLPNAGKSSLFRAISRQAAEVAPYPFTTVDPNIAVVPVPDERLDAVARTIGADPVTYETVELRDIAGLVRGAHRGEGLGNRFLAQIREVDVVVIVVRAFAAPDVPHPDGHVDPVADAELLEAELLQADLERAGERLDRARRRARSLERAAVAEAEWLEQVHERLARGEPVRGLEPPEDAPDAARELQALTAKPFLYVANVDEGAPLEPPPELVAHATARGARAVAVSARIEAELADLEPSEAEALRSELELGASALERVVGGAFALLDLVTFFTAHEGGEARAHAVPRGTTARRAAGEVHSDMERGFVAAEVVAWDELVAAGSLAAARERALVRTEGRDYSVRDGDVIRFRFTPPR